MAKQQRVVLRNCGIINPEDIEDYIAVDGYKAIEKVLGSMKPEEVIEEIKISGLRGRGGAGFLRGSKWNAAKQSPGKEKNIWYATPTKEIRALSWTVRSWRETLIL